MEPIKMLEELVVKLGGNLTSAKVGIDYTDLWYWLSEQEPIPPEKVDTIRYIHGLEFNPATRTDR